jgi:hypothetical protein
MAELLREEEEERLEEPRESARVSVRQHKSRRSTHTPGPDGPAGVGPRSGLAPAGRGRSPR